MDKDDKRNHKLDHDYAEWSMRWYGWGSPIGMSIFLVGLAMAILMLVLAYKVFTAQSGARMTYPRRLPMMQQQQNVQ